LSYKKFAPLNKFFFIGVVACRLLAATPKPLHHWPFHYHDLLQMVVMLSGLPGGAAGSVVGWCGVVDATS